MQLRSALLALGALAWAADLHADGTKYAERASTEVAAYADTDHVAVLTPSISGHIESPTAGWSVDGSYLVDAISAASVDIVSTASRRWTEVRQAGDARFSYRRGDWGGSLEGSLSSEPDYLAFAAGGYVTRDFDQHNVSVILGYGYGHDTIGRAGTPFSVYSHSFEHNAFHVGVTRLINRRTVLSVGVDATVESGDSSKPYRYIPLFAPAVAPQVPVGATLADLNRLGFVARAIERLPLSRDRFGLTGRLAHRLTHSTMRVEGTLYDDSWGLRALSGDGRWLLDIGSRLSLGPHLRAYAQSPVSFWNLAYVGTADSVPTFRTGDRELGPLVNLTTGASARWELWPRWSLQNWAVVGSVDTTYTHFSDDLYITRRGSILTAAALEASW